MFAVDGDNTIGVHKRELRFGEWDTVFALVEAVHSVIPLKGYIHPVSYSLAHYYTYNNTYFRCICQFFLCGESENELAHSLTPYR